MRRLPYEATYLGLTQQEAYLLLAACNGCVMHHAGYGDNAWVRDKPDGCAQYLAAAVQAAADGSHADLAAFGRDLDLPEDEATAETPFQKTDLAEKILQLGDAKAFALVWWITGFWDGVVD